jgi:hypothetical protein
LKWRFWHRDVHGGRSGISRWAGDRAIVGRNHAQAIVDFAILKRCFGSSISASEVFRGYFEEKLPKIEAKRRPGGIFTNEAGT